MDNRTRLGRLKKLKRILELVPEEKFYIDQWFNERYHDKPIDVAVPDNFIRVECTTAACALGWAAMDKGFRRAGLKLKKDGRRCADVEYKGKIDYSAGKSFFGITFKESIYLFATSEYGFSIKKDIKPKHVIERVDELITQYEDKQ